MIQTPLKEVGIEYPGAGEMVARGPYSFRISAPSEASEVRVSIDDGPWEPCRADDGRWWFDWSAREPGPHVAVTRVIEKDGTLILSQPRVFRILA
jgi:hypothetical protein